jgi:hypothetical protein
MGREVGLAQSKYSASCPAVIGRPLKSSPPTDALTLSDGTPPARGSALPFADSGLAFRLGSKQAATHHPQVACHWSRYERSLRGRTHAAYSTETSESAEPLDEPCIRTMRYRPNLPNKRGCWALTVEAYQNVKYRREARSYEINGKGRYLRQQAVLS